MARQGLALAGGVIGAYFGGPVGAQIGFAIGSAIGGYVDPEKVQGPKLGNIPMQTGRDGVPIPVGWGICHTAGNILMKNALQEVEKEEGGGKGGGPVVVNTYYYRTFAIGIMRSIEGPIASILRIWENDKLVYDARAAPAIAPADTTAFGEGLRIYYGDDGQTPDPDLEAEWGVGNTPYFRGLPYVVFVDKDITEFAGAIPQYRFEIKTRGNLNVTSRPYAIEEVNGLDPTFALDETQPMDVPIEGLDPTFAVTDIGIQALREYYTMDVEALDATFAVTDITLDPSLLSYGMDPEALDATFAVTDITLDPRLVTYLMDDEALDATFAVTDITLT